MESRINSSRPRTSPLFVGVGGGQFPSTRWSLVRAVSADDTLAATALAELCKTYWYPLYVFARRTGLTAPDAEDATQGFLARVIEKEMIARAREELGTLRSFLLRGLKNYLANERKARYRTKRGGGHLLVSLDAAAIASAERRYQFEPDTGTNDSPDQWFERRWATTVLENVFATLRDEYGQADKGALFDALKPTLTSARGDSPTYAAIGDSFAMTEAAVKLVAFRMRQRFRDILREQVGQTVQTEREVNEEILALFRAFAR
ncbi:MAG: hypothetical protein R3F19_16810 [Verrucomicrobiales bacterium]